MSEAADRAAVLAQGRYMEASLAASRASFEADLATLKRTMAESYGDWRRGHEERLAAHITSAVKSPQEDQDVAQDREGASAMGSTSPPVGSGPEQLTADDIRAMDMATYASRRGELGVRSPGNTGLFGREAS
jgi:hypothetical protein